MSFTKCGEVLGGWLGEMETLFQFPQLHQGLVAYVSKSTGLPVNQSWVLALPLPTCVTLSFKSQFSHL